MLRTLRVRVGCVSDETIIHRGVVRVDVIVTRRKKKLAYPYTLIYTVPKVGNKCDIYHSIYNSTNGLQTTTHALYSLTTPRSTSGRSPSG